MEINAINIIKILNEQAHGHSFHVHCCYTVTLGRKIYTSTAGVPVVLVTNMKYVPMYQIKEGHCNVCGVGGVHILMLDL